MTAAFDTTHQTQKHCKWRKPVDDVEETFLERDGKSWDEARLVNLIFHAASGCLSVVNVVPASLRKKNDIVRINFKFTGIAKSRSTIAVELSWF